MDGFLKFPYGSHFSLINDITVLILRGPIVLMMEPVMNGWRLLLQKPSLMLGFVITAVFLLISVVSMIWVPYDVTTIDVAGRFQAPNGGHWFGTDHFGRDILSMVMIGAQTSLFVALSSIIIGVVIGLPLGLLAAAYPGAWDQAITRGNDILFAFPSLLLAILFAAVLGPSVSNAILAIGIFNIPVFARVTRGQAKSFWPREFVLAAMASGKSRFRISWDHILPLIDANHPGADYNSNFHRYRCGSSIVLCWIRGAAAQSKLGAHVI